MKRTRGGLTGYFFAAVRADIFKSVYPGLDLAVHRDVGDAQELPGIPLPQRVNLLEVLPLLLDAGGIQLLARIGPDTGHPHGGYAQRRAVCVVVGSPVGPLRIGGGEDVGAVPGPALKDRKSTRLNSSHLGI